MFTSRLSLIRPRPAHLAAGAGLLMAGGLALHYARKEASAENEVPPHQDLDGRLLVNIGQGFTTTFNEDMPLTLGTGRGIVAHSTTQPTSYEGAPYCRLRVKMRPEATDAEIEQYLEKEQRKDPNTKVFREGEYIIIEHIFSATEVSDLRDLLLFPDFKLHYDLAPNHHTLQIVTNLAELVEQSSGALALFPLGPVLPRIVSDVTSVGLVLDVQVKNVNPWSALWAMAFMESDPWFYLLPRGDVEVLYGNKKLVAEFSVPAPRIRPASPE